MSLFVFLLIYKCFEIDVLRRIVGAAPAYCAIKLPQCGLSGHPLKQCWRVAEPGLIQPWLSYSKATGAVRSASVKALLLCGIAEDQPIIRSNTDGMLYNFIIEV